MPEWMKCKYESVSELDLRISSLDPNHVGDDTVQGIFYVIHSLGGEKAGYFKFKRRWYAVDIVPDHAWTLTRLKGVQVKFKHDWADYHNPTHYIKICRTWETAENIDII